MDGSCLTRDDAYDQPTVLLSRSLVAEVRAAEPLDEHDDTATDVSALNGPLDVGGTTTMIAADAGPISSGEITAQTAQSVESEFPPTAQPASDPTTATLLAPGFVHLVPGTLVGEYEVEKLLGSGGIGAVYGARHERLGRRAAIKVIAPSLSVDAAAVERFEQEAQALARLSHPNIVGVLSVGALPGDGRSYLVMEWLDGETLQARLARGHVALDFALDVVDQVARGLDAAHAAGIVHRDLKPDNVWLQRVGAEPRPIAKLLDFGLAKLAQHRRSEETAAHVMFGTAAYMSPEQCRSTRDVGPETDVYALGCVAYELLCGRLPFAYDNVAELVAAHQAEEPPRPRQLASQLSPALDDLLLAMLSKDPRRRPTVTQVRERLAQLRTVSRRAAPRSVAQLAASTAPRSAQRSRAARGATLLAVVALAVVVTLAVREWTEETEEPSHGQRVDAAQIDGARDHREAAVLDAPGPAADVPVDAPSSAAARTPAIDASVPPPVAAGMTATRRRKVVVAPVDAAISLDADASTLVSDPPDPSRVEDPTVAPAGTRVGSPPRRQPAPSASTPPRAPGADPPTVERAPQQDRDRTFNPFKRQPR